MDDLDRLYYEFVEILRRERPSALTEPLTVRELHERLIPYRRVRDRVGFLSNDDYEAALSRLLSGERGYLLSEDEMQREVRAGLEEPLPDIRRYRAFPEVRVWLNPEEVPPPGDIRYAPPELHEGADWAGPLVERPETLDAHEGGRHRGTAGAEEAEGEEWAAGEVEGPAAVDAASEETAAEEGLPMGGAEVAAERAGDAAAAPEVCRRCGAELPGGAVFCPFCGRRASPDRCRACGAELELDWRFCASCGTPTAGERDALA
jgi:ribosomal protein L40E